MTVKKYVSDVNLKLTVDLLLAELAKADLYNVEKIKNLETTKVNKDGNKVLSDFNFTEDHYVLLENMRGKLDPVEFNPNEPDNFPANGLFSVLFSEDMEVFISPTETITIPDSTPAALINFKIHGTDSNNMLLFITLEDNKKIMVKNNLTPEGEAQWVKISTMIDIHTVDNSKIEKQIEELFQSGRDGKKLLESDIIAHGGSVNKTDSIATFKELQNGIQSIPKGYQKGDYISIKDVILNPVKSDVLDGMQILSKRELPKNTDILDTAIFGDSVYIAGDNGVSKHSMVGDGGSRFLNNNTSAKYSKFAIHTSEQFIFAINAATGKVEVLTHQYTTMKNVPTIPSRASRATAIKYSQTLSSLLIGYADGYVSRFVIDYNYSDNTISINNSPSWTKSFHGLAPTDVLDLGVYEIASGPKIFTVGKNEYFVRISSSGVNELEYNLKGKGYLIHLFPAGIERYGGAIEDSILGCTGKDNFYVIRGTKTMSKVTIPIEGLTEKDLLSYGSETIVDSYLSTIRQNLIFKVNQTTKENLLVVIPPIEYLDSPTSVIDSFYVGYVRQLPVGDEDIERVILIGGQNGSYAYIVNDTLFVVKTGTLKYENVTLI